MAKDLRPESRIDDENKQNAKLPTTFEESGLSEQYRDAWNANPYLNPQRKKTGWDSLVSMFGGRSGYDKYMEDARLKSDEYIAQLVNQHREETYNSSEAASARQRDAGINPNITGQSGGSNEASEGVELDSSSLTSQASDSLMDAVQNLVTSISGCTGLISAFQNMKSTALDNLQKSTSIADSLFSYGKKYAEDTFRFVNHKDDTLHYNEKEERFEWRNKDGKVVEYLAPGDADFIDNEDRYISQLGVRGPLSRGFKKNFSHGVNAGLNGIKSVVERLETEARGIDASVGLKGRQKLFGGTGQDKAVNDVFDALFELYQAEVEADTQTAHAEKAKGKFTEDMMNNADGRIAGESLNDTNLNTKSRNRYEETVRRVRQKLLDDAEDQPAFVKMIYAAGLDAINNFAGDPISGVADVMKFASPMKLRGRR